MYKLNFSTVQKSVIISLERKPVTQSPPPRIVSSRTQLHHTPENLVLIIFMCVLLETDNTCNSSKESCRNDSTLVLVPPPSPPFTAVRSVGIVVVPPLPISPHLVQKRTDTIKPCTCKRVLITSTGVLPKTDAAPAVAPKSPVRSVGTFLFLSSPLYQSFMVSMTKKRIAWLLPCLMMVGVKPWYTPCRPAEIQKDCMRRMGNQSSYYGFHDEEAYSSLVFCPASRWWVSDPGTPLADLQKSKQTAREEGETSPLIKKQHTAWLRP